MRHPLSLLLACSLVACAAPAQIVDDFGDGGWTQFSNTPGTMTAERGKLRLVDAEGEPAWMTVSKTFKVDVDAMPLFILDVTEIARRGGTVKLIRKEPFDKQTVLEIHQSGLYVVDVKKKYGWTGTIDIETCLYAGGDRADITYGYVKYAAALTPEEQTRLDERLNTSLLRTQLKPFELIPTFVSCSYYFQSKPLGAINVAYRAKGGDWQPAYPPVWVPEDGMYRGSVVRLNEDTAYELRITDGGGQQLAAGEFRTWSSTVPIAKTVVLDETNFDGQLKITDIGTPDGWIKYTAKPGTVLRNDRTKSMLVLDGAEYVVLEGLTLRGGLQNVVEILGCNNVRVSNCDIAGWGRLGYQRFDLNGMFYPNATGSGGGAINWDTGIVVRHSKGTVIERCWIHDPLTRANSWYYAHPAGPQAVGIDKPTSTVLRYNDFVGSDQHRWNDAIEGSGNFHPDGGFNRDADIYGSFHCFANDDAIEIDGGQINVRVFDNKFEGCLCGVSIQGCMSGPSYVFNNLLVNMGDERSMAGQTIKTSSNEAGPSAVAHLFNNTCWGDGSDLGLLRILKIVAKNNLFASRSAIRGREGSPQSDVDYNLQVNASSSEAEEAHGVVAPAGLVDPAAGQFQRTSDSAANGKGLPLANFAPGQDGKVDIGASGDLPYRPIPVSVAAPQVVFSTADLAARRTLTVTAKVGGTGFSSPYTIAQNDAFDWFSVTPKAGTLKSGDTVTFTIAVKPELMTSRSRYKGAFLIRMADGFSRPVLVYADTDYKQPAKPARQGVWAQYLEAEAPSGGKVYEVVNDADASGGKAIKLEGSEGKEPAEYRFTAPKDGKVYLLVRLRNERPDKTDSSVVFGLDDGDMDRSKLRARSDWSWCMMAQNRSMSLICLQSFDVKAGEHVIKLAPREAVLVDMLAVADNPEMFE